VLPTTTRIASIFLAALGVLSCVARSDAETRTPTQAIVYDKDVAALGREIFFDRSLSASGKMACATCHDPNYAYGPPPGKAIAIGGEHMDRVGTRAVPSLRYLQTIPAFSEHMHFTDGDVALGGGFMWDGRAASLHEQARLPLLDANEMANPDVASVVAKLRRATYATQFRKLFGADVFQHPNEAFERAMLALEAFQKVPQEFYPYSSKYDAFLRGEVELTDAEERGVAVFKDPNKGNCASCHIPVQRNGAFPVFTDFDYINVGVPRNRNLPVNDDPHYYDLGLCGPKRKDLAATKEYCGLFRAPTLRNVALRDAFFHNGVFHTLREVLEFYAERDTHPEKWYSHNADGSVRKADDLPPELIANLNVEPPFDRKLGDKPPMSAQDIDDLLAFLQTLTDGYHVPDAQMARDRPDEYAWRLFIALSTPADKPQEPDEPAAWERWKNANDIYLQDGVDPGPWATPGDNARRFQILTPQQQVNARRIVNGTMQPLESSLATATRLKEMRMNETAYDYVRANELYNVDGQVKHLRDNDPIAFPVGSQEVKAEWTLIDGKERSKYHTLVLKSADGTARVFGLTALHVMSKDLPTWFWATFEHVDNPSRSDAEPWLLRSADAYACGSATADCNRAPQAVEHSVWKYYRLRGTQTAFVDKDAKPTQLANSRFESGIQTTASCMTCHSRASIGVANDKPQRLTILKQAADSTHPSKQGYVGEPQREWFYEKSDAGVERRIFMPLDFVWSLSKAQPKPMFTISRSTP